MAALVMLGGCGRLFFDDAHADARGDVPPTPPWQGEFTLEEPQLVSELNVNYESECFVVPDGKTIYFASYRPGVLGFNDIFSATRDGPGSPWRNVTHAVEISSTFREGRLSTTSDGLTACFWSNRTGFDQIWTVTRASTSVPFDNANAALVAGIDDPTSKEFDPWMSRDGNRIYAVANVTTGELAVAERLSATTFSALQPIANVNSTENEDNPALSGDELFMVFTSHRPGIGLSDLYYTRRADPFASWDAPQLLPVVNTPSSDAEPCLTDAGELFFSSDRRAGIDTFDLYRTRFIPQ